MTKEEIIATIKQCHEQDMSRTQIAKCVGMPEDKLHHFMQRNLCGRSNLGFAPLPRGGSGINVYEYPTIKMSEEEIALLYNGQRYESLNIPSTGRPLVMARNGGTVMTASSMNF